MEIQIAQTPIFDQALDLHKDALELTQKLYAFLSQNDTSLPLSARLEAARLYDALYHFAGHLGFYSKIESGDACRHSVQSPDAVVRGGN